MVQSEQIPIQIVEISTKQPTKLQVYSIRQLISGLWGREKSPYRPITEIDDAQQLDRRYRQVDHARQCLTTIYTKSRDLRNPEEAMTQQEQVLISEIQKRARAFQSGSEFIDALSVSSQQFDPSLPESSFSLSDLSTKLMVIESLKGCSDKAEFDQRLKVFTRYPIC